MRFSWPRLLTRWQRRRQRWPLSRQIATLFTVLMIANGLLISAALDQWGAMAVEREISAMSPSAQRTYKNIQTGKTPTVEQLKQLDNEFKPISDRLTAELDTALYALIGMAGVVTMLLGYLVLGSLGRGLNSVAMAARRIADGDLTARATLVGFASREETQLIVDFNTMSAALHRSQRELAESTASIAHELRTPLTILRGRLHGIADGVFALEAKEVEGLLYQVEGLGRLVDDLQTISLAGAQRLVLSVLQTDLAQEVSRVLATMAPDLEGAGLDAVLDLAPAPLVADGVRIRQVIGAVLANAIRYAPGSGVLRIATLAHATEAVLEITDHGPGLPDGADTRAFDRFWRGEASRNRNSGGSGLGLSVVRVIVEAHGGTATLGNHDGGGARFVMTLPTV
jgi:two-component system, OmpR family, sensor histidine kinase AdeS